MSGIRRFARRGSRSRAARLCALALLLAGAVSAQGGAGERGSGMDRLRHHLFEPELVMAHQGEIGLSEEQKQALVGELQQTQSELVPLQLEISEAGERLARIVEAARVDEEAVLVEAERVMRLETEIKRRHLQLVVRIKNLLGPEQQAQLRQIRGRQRHGSP